MALDKALTEAPCRMSHLGEPGDVRKSTLGHASRRVTAEASHSRIAATNWRSSQPGVC